MTCPLCGKPAEAVYRPFCSRRCADVDLGKWFNEDYRIPAESPDEDRDVGTRIPAPMRPRTDAARWRIEAQRVDLARRNTYKSRSSRAVAGPAFGGRRPPSHTGRRPAAEAAPR